MKPTSTVKQRGLFTLMLVLGLWLTLIAAGGSAAGNVYDYRQCANGAGLGDPVGECHWTPGALNATNSTYHEGDAVPYRLQFGGLAPGTYVLAINYQTSKGGKMAFDYLAGYDHSEPFVDQADLCNGLALANCTSLTPGTFPIPADPNIADKGVTQVAGAMTVLGGQVTGFAYQAPLIYPFTGDTTRTVHVTFKTATGCTSNCSVLLAWGGHISSQVQWGNGNSAANIPGAPYHMTLLSLNGLSVGSRDLPLMAGAIPIGGRIVVIKDAHPDDPQEFPFTFQSTSELESSFVLVDDGLIQRDLFTYRREFQGLGPGTYTVTEGDVTGWTLASITCVSEKTSSTYTIALADRKAEIDLREFERGTPDTVTCTFVNKKDGVPSIQATKTPSPSVVPAPGGDVVFSVTVENTGATAVTIDSLTDNVYGDITAVQGDVSATECATPQSLSPGQTYSCTFTAAVSGSAGDIHYDTVLAEGYDTNNVPVEDAADATVAIVGGAVNACADDVGVYRMTDILGAGMGNTLKSTSAKVVVPNYQQAVSLFGQIAGKKEGMYAYRYARFIYPNNTYINVNTPASTAYRDGAVFWFGTYLTPSANIRGRLFQPANARLPRAMVLYPTYQTTERYWNYFDAYAFDHSSLNHVYWADGWFPSQEFIIQLEEHLPEAREVTVKLALVDNDKDARPVNVTVSATNGTDTVSQTQAPVGPNKGDQLNILTYVMTVPVGTHQIKVDLVSPFGTGDSVAIVGLTAHYLCEITPP